MVATAMKRGAWAGFVYCALMSTPAMADLPDAPKQSINIPADDLVACLELLAKQSGIEFCLRRGSAEGNQSAWRERRLDAEGGRA